MFFVILSGWCSVFFGSVLMTVYGGMCMGFSGSEGIKRNISQTTNDVKKSFDSQANSKRKDSQSDAIAAESPDSPAAQVNVSSRSVAEGSSTDSSFQSTVTKVGGILEQVAELATPTGNGAVSSGDSSTDKQVDISTKSGAQNAVDLISEAATSVTALKGSLETAQSKPESVDSSAETQKTSTEKNASPIRDAEVAKGVTDNLAAEIRQSAAATVLASFKNINAQTVSKLLQ